MFNLDNTTGFSAADLELLNRAAEILINDGLDRGNACDVVNNNWLPSGNTVRSLIAR